MKLAYLALLLSAPAFAGNFFSSGIFAPATDPVPPGHSLKQVIELSTNRDAEVTYLSVMANDADQAAGFYGANTPPETAGTPHFIQHNIF